MLERLLHSKWLKSSKAWGVELLESGEQSSLNAVLLQRSKTDIRIEEYHDAIRLDQLEELVKGTVPVLLAINSAQVINRKAETVEFNDKEVLEHIIPNARQSDFYFQRSPLKENEEFLSIARRDALESVLEQFESCGMKVTHLFLGPFCIQPILGLIDKLPSELRLSKQKVGLTGSTIDYVNPTDEAVEERMLNIGDESLPQEGLVAFSAAFQYFFESLPSLPVQSVHTAWEEYQHQSLFSYFSKGSLALFLLVLLINFFAFDSYRKNYQGLEQEVSLRQGQLNQLDLLRGEVKERESFFNNAQLLKSSQLSWYADQLALDLPRTITLRGMHLNPLGRKLKPEKKALFQFKLIRVSGTSVKREQFSDWLRELRTKDWIEDVAILNYNEEGSGRSGSFHIEIKLSTRV